jgi:excisionase family DNA binding protein
MEDRQLSLTEVAGLMGVSERTVRRWIKSGKLRAYKPGRDYRIPESGLREFVEESEVSPKGMAPPSLQRSFNGLLEQERRLRPWVTYVSRRAEWCEKVLGRKPSEEFNNPWASLDSAIQWAVYVGTESVVLQDTIKREVLTADALTDEAEELRALLDRFVEIERRTDERVNAMMEDAGLGEAQKRARLEVIHGERSA